jgi:hypothetical protein
VVEFILLSVVLLHILHEVLTFDFVLRVVDSTLIVVINILLDVLFSDLSTIKNVIIITVIIVSSVEIFSAIGAIVPVTR